MFDNPALQKIQWKVFNVTINTCFNYQATLSFH